jgi:putative inorganic carbon (HCO3(-)) transporter
LGTQYMNFIYLAIFLGILYQKVGFPRTKNSRLIFIFAGSSYISLWNCAFVFSLPLPYLIQTSLQKHWKDYFFMVCTYFLVTSVIKTEKQLRRLVVVLALVVLLIGVRNYRGFYAGSDYAGDRRAGGPFETVGLGSNHFGAFAAYCSVAFMGLYFLDTDKKRKTIFLVTSIFALHPLVFSYSRGAYAGFSAAFLVLALLKKRILLIPALIIYVSWTTLLPTSVVERIAMTSNESGTLDHASAVRIKIWENAYDLFKTDPIFGVGFGGYTESGGVEGFTDTHNVFLKFLCEQGIIGISLFVFVLLKALLSGWSLFRRGNNGFLRGLGLGFLCATVAMIVNNGFGDRWSYFVLGGYFWVLWALVDRGILLSREERAEDLLAGSAPLGNLADQDLEVEEQQNKVRLVSNCINSRRFRLHPAN